jgi:hypothetical protein
MPTLRCCAGAPCKASCIACATGAASQYDRQVPGDSHDCAHIKILLILFDTPAAQVTPSQLFSGCDGRSGVQHSKQAYHAQQRTHQCLKAPVAVLEGKRGRCLHKVKRQ